MYRQLGAVVTVILTTVTALATMATAAAASRDVENIAHRGGAAHAPENTLAACALAQVEGADTCEFDIQQTKDDRLVLIHDQTLNRTTDVEEVFPGRSPWRVSDFTLAEIRRLDAGSWFSPRYRGERVPTLEQALRATSNSRIGLLLEIKHVPANRDIDRLVAAELERTRPWWSNKRLAVQAFDWKSMRTFHGLMPNVPIALLGKAPTERLSELSEYANGINLPHKQLSAEYVDEVHKHGMHVYSGTANRSSVLQRLISYGVDGIMTNRPDHLDAVKRAW